MNSNNWLNRTVSQQQSDQFCQSKLILTENCLMQITSDLQPSIKREHEGIVFLLGRTDGQVTLAINSFCPEAETTSGSFDVSAKAMIPCTKFAYNHGLQIVGQVHTHPKEAFHSYGDEKGAYMRYTGFTSLVIPEYGKNLPSLDYSACYMWHEIREWSELAPSEIIVVNGA